MPTLTIVIHDYQLFSWIISGLLCFLMNHFFMILKKNIPEQYWFIDRNVYLCHCKLWSLDRLM